MSGSSTPVSTVQSLSLDLKILCVYFSVFLLLIFGHAVQCVSVSSTAGGTVQSSVWVEANHVHDASISCGADVQFAGDDALEQ